MFQVGRLHSAHGTARSRVSPIGVCRRSAARRSPCSERSPIIPQVVSTQRAMRTMLPVVSGQPDKGNHNARPVTGSQAAVGGGTRRVSVGHRFEHHWHTPTPTGWLNWPIESCPSARRRSRKRRGPRVQPAIWGRRCLCTIAGTAGDAFGERERVGYRLPAREPRRRIPTLHESRHCGLIDAG
jgi:hypothetical protein